MKKACLLIFVLLVHFPFISLSQAQIEYSEIEIEEYKAQLGGLLEGLKPKLIEKNPSLRIIIRDFPFEWENLKKEILTLGEVHLKEMLDNAVITENSDEEWNWVHVIMDQPKMSSEIARIGIRLQFKYFPYYLSQASDEATQELLYAMVDVLRGYQSGTWGDKTSCYDWISGGVLVPPFGRDGKIFPQTGDAINKIFETRSLDVRDFNPFLEDAENSDIFYAMLQRLTNKFGLEGTFNLNLLIDVKELNREEDRLIVCDVNEYFFKDLNARYTLSKKLKFFRDYLISSHLLDDHVINLIETRKQILANQ